jgi:hypothetical protein
MEGDLGGSGRGASRLVLGEFDGPSAAAHWRSDSDSESDSHSSADEAADAGATKTLRRGPNDVDPFFSAEADDEDEKWVNATRGGRQSDAILSCPCCMETVTIDCQRHVARDDQWRAMFVRNVRVDETVRFRPADDASLNAKREGASVESSPDLEESDGPYFRASCDTCGTPVGVRDTDEVYHFFNVFPTNA